MSANVIALLILVVGWTIAAGALKFVAEHYRRGIDAARAEHDASKAALDETLAARRAENDRSDRIHAEWRQMMGRPDWDARQRVWAERASRN